MPKVLVDDHEIEFDAAERLNGIQAAARAGVEVPHYCWHPGLTVVASCRMCLVETGKLDAATGKISMLPKLVPACQTPATDGTVFVTQSEKVRQARAMVEEDLLLRHPVDCPICDKAGECALQDYHFKYGQGERRAEIKPFHSRRRPMGETVSLFVDRCVMCTRCVRFTREVSGTSELMVIHRGAHEEIDVMPGFPLENKLAGNVVDLCPVGALGDVDFLYQQRVWFMKKHDGVCAGCSTGCSIAIEENQDRVYRLKPRENPHVNQWWMCDDGRYGYHHVHDERRLVGPRRRSVAGQGNGNGTGAGAWENVEWSALPAELDGRLRKAGRLAALLSPHLTVEVAYLLATFIKSIDPQALLGLAAVPRVGDDETYPGRFTIRAEKCPNRAGVEAILARVAGEVLSQEQWLARLPESGAQGVWVAGGYVDPQWIDDATAEQIAAVPLLVVQDLFPSPLAERATYQLPASAFAEREGSYVNANLRLQSFTWAVRPPAGVLPEGPLYWRLAGRGGLFQARVVMEEIAREMAFFSAALQPVPAVGVDLRVNQLAESMASGAAQG